MVSANRLKCIVSYDGTHFSGYQVQPGKRTVQKEIETALKRLHKGKEIPIIASGRTDAGVHAYGQVIHFDSPLHIAPDNWTKALNANLPADIVIRYTSIVDSSFHARFDVRKKTYRYYIHNAKEANVFQRNYIYHYPYPLSIKKMQQASKLLLGKHDFTSFCSAKTDVEDKVRTIFSIEISQKQPEMTIELCGDGFLYNMVRIIVGTLLEVGSGRKEPAAIQTILGQKDRTHAGKTVPGHGLYLWKVVYND